MLLPLQLWGRSGQVTMDETLRQEAFVFYLKKRFTLAKKALPRHRKESATESEREVVLEQTYMGEYKTTSFWVKGKCTKCILSIN